MRTNLMIEGQEDVSWAEWVALAEAVEASGLEGMFRSDHYQSVAKHTDRGALDAWATLSALGQVTQRIRLGTMVSPASFRHPSVLAKSAVTADHVSGGRVELGMGAGWHELEHHTYGFPFHDVRTRYAIFEEQVEIVARQLREDRFDLRGEHYTLLDCEARPKPVQERLPLIIGGSGGPRSVAIAARWADEYNTVFPSLDEARDRRAAVVRACEAEGRDPITFSMMIGCIIGTDEAEVVDRARRLHDRSGSEEPFDGWFEQRRGVWLAGTVEQVAERLAAYEGVGVQRVMLQHLLHDDTAAIALLGDVG